MRYIRYIRWKVGLLLLACYVLFSLQTAHGQWLDDWQISIHAAVAPFNADTEGERVTLTRDADLSPVPSVVDYDPQRFSFGLNLGATIRPRQADASANTWPTWAGLLETTFATSQLFENVSQLDFVAAGPGAFFYQRVGEATLLSIGGFAFAGYTWGTVGSVGTAAGDIYLDTPEGERFGFGSTIDASTFSFGIDVMAGLTFQSRFMVEAGYRWTTQPKNWHYSVSDGTVSSGLPVAGFSANPVGYDMNGPLLRLSYIL